MARIDGNAASSMPRLWSALLLAAAAVTAQAASPDREFLAAREAARAGNAARLDQHAARLKGHLLEPYVRYWQLSARLEQASPEEIRAFLDAHRDTPLSDQLRRAWLKQLGERGEWERFNAELPLLVRDDVEITCYALQSRLRVNASETLPEVRPLWFIARDLPASCTPLFEALQQAGKLSRDDLWTRLRLALEVGQVRLARSVAQWLPPGEAPEPGLLERIATNPARHLERLQPADLKQRAGREAALFALHRLARVAPRQAVGHLVKLEPRLTQDERAYVWGRIGLLGAMRHDPDALAWFEHAGGLSDLQLAWRARAALRARHWREVLASIDAMTGRESSRAAWRYWKARSLKALGRGEEAVALLKPLASEFTFYGQLALEELGGKVALPPAHKPSAAEVRAVGEQAGLRRALALYRLGLRLEGVREWIWAIRDFDDRQLLAASRLALRHDLYDRAINTADRTEALHDFGLRYLAPYREVLNLHTTELELDEAWVYGLIRQESRFISSARSHAGASGLMQLMPGTARWVAKQLGLRDWRWTQVTEIETNVSLGTYYLRHVLDVLDGQPVLASAAYNAGPGRARAWRPQAPMEGAIYAETIPFNETRDYVKRVMANATYYTLNFQLPPLPLRKRMGVVDPRQPDAEKPLGDTP